jgi:hypothetical protein
MYDVMLLRHCLSLLCDHNLLQLLQMPAFTGFAQGGKQLQALTKILQVLHSSGIGQLSLAWFRM